jgi:hypothetical protein
MYTSLPRPQAGVQLSPTVRFTNASSSPHRDHHRCINVLLRSAPDEHVGRRQDPIAPKDKHPDASTSQAPDDVEEGGPPDQRPLIVKILLSVVMRAWQSMGRFFAVIPGNNPLRWLALLVAVAFASVCSSPFEKDFYCIGTSC